MVETGGGVATIVVVARGRDACAAPDVKPTLMISDGEDASGGRHGRTVRRPRQSRSNDSLTGATSPWSVAVRSRSCSSSASSGRWRLLADGRPVELGGAKQRALLALLLLESGRVVSSDRLLDALWDGAAARDRNRVAPELRVAAAEVSSARTRSRRGRPGTGCGSSRRTSTSPACGGSSTTRVPVIRRDAPACSAKPSAVWRGDALAELAYEPFAQTEIARLEELRLTLVEEHAEAELAIGRHAELVAELERTVARIPLRERLCGQLMLALYRSGRQAEALEVYRKARATLVAELGIEPSPLLAATPGVDPSPGGADRGAEAPPRRASISKRSQTSCLRGRLTIVLGADVEPLAVELARHFGLDTERPELARVSQAIAILNGSGPLQDALHALLEETEPGPSTGSWRHFRHCLRRAASPARSSSRPATTSRSKQRCWPSRRAVRHDRLPRVRSAPRQLLSRLARRRSHR